ncbi:hypothetical protein THIX_50101 [Thiomonas sp. X19]|nr:hypothetical protein THIX_50101 [Thiomonas sp. X19]
MGARWRVLASVRRLQGLDLLVPGALAGRRLTWRLEPGFGVGLTIRRTQHHRCVLQRWAQAEVDPPSPCAIRRRAIYLMG